MAVTRDSGFPIISYRPDGGAEIEDRVHGTSAEIAAYLPEPGDPHPDDATAYCIKRSRLMPQNGANATDQLYYIDLLYGQDTPGGFIYTPEQSTLEKPIEAARTTFCPSNFLMKWKYRLAGSPAASDTVPSFWDTATSPNLSNANAQLYRWLNDSAELPKDTTGRWRILADRTKPGVEAFLAGSTIVRAQAWYGSYTNYYTVMSLYIGLGAYRLVPGETFGLTSEASDNKWLLLPDVQGGKDGNYWTINMRYQYSAEGWDTDTYFG